MIEGYVLWLVRASVDLFTAWLRLYDDACGARYRNGKLDPSLGYA